MALITASKYHRTVDGTELVKAREGLLLNQGAFGLRCGWSQQFQSQLEAGENEITSEEAAKIMQAIYYYEEER